MGLDERVFYLVLGILIGFVLGYFTHKLQNIEEKVEEVDMIVKKDRGEGGFIRFPSWSSIKRWFSKIDIKHVALFIVVLLSAAASFQSQIVSNKIERNSAEDQKTQERIVRILTCNSSFLGKTIVALNERTTYSADQADANVKLQKEQLRLLTFALTVPPPSARDGRKAVDRYFKTLNNYVDLASKTASKQLKNAYPTSEEFTSCVNAKEIR